MSSDTPRRETRSMSAALHTPSSPTSPGPPVRPLPPIPTSALGTGCNPYFVDLVLPFSIAVEGREDRKKAEKDIKESYEALLRTLEGAGGLRLASRPGRAGKGNEEVWLFVAVSDSKIRELVENERVLDQAHGLNPHPAPDLPQPATRLRLLYDLLTAPPLQHGLGITPGKGKWSRVKGIVALHDEERDHEWVERWTVGGDWKVGLLRGLGQKAGESLAAHQPSPVHLYFNFLTTYTLSLLPISLVSVLFYLFTPADSYPPLYAFALALYSTIFLAVWRIKERKLAVRWGTRGSETVAVGRLRPEFVVGRGLGNVDDVQIGEELGRDAKVALSVPVIISCGVVLGVVLMGIFILEAFVGQLWEGYGKEVVPLVPTALFAIVVPQVVALFNTFSAKLVKWENHPTHTGEEKSLTAKTFAMNAIVAYLGLYLSAYVYLPFGPHLMGHLHQRLSNYQGKTNIVAAADTQSLGPRLSPSKQHQIKAGRLKSQLFAYTVTNQVVNTFLELGLPYILRFIKDWRAGKTTVKEVLQKRGHYGNDDKPCTTPEEVEKRFLNKVEQELALPDYTIFTDYAEMVTQFGYVTIWSIVWPLAPIFALINNYFELRSDALKICKHVRRPVGDRVETIGSWLETMGIIAWLGAVTSATLIYLFRPRTDVGAGNGALAHLLASYDVPPSFQSLLPTLITLACVALASSHGFIVLRWFVDAVAERLLWRGSPEDIEEQKNKSKSTALTTVESKREAKGMGKLAISTEHLDDHDFWNGGEEGAKEIQRVFKGE